MTPGSRRPGTDAPPTGAAAAWLHVMGGDAASGATVVKRPLSANTKTARDIGQKKARIFAPDFGGGGGTGDGGAGFDRSEVKEHQLVGSVVEEEEEEEWSVVGTKKAVQRLRNQYNKQQKTNVKTSFAKVMDELTALFPDLNK